MYGLQEIQLLNFWCFKMVFFKTSVVHYHKYHRRNLTYVVHHNCENGIYWNDESHELKISCWDVQGVIFPTTNSVSLHNSNGFLGSYTRTLFLTGPLIISLKSVIKVLNSVIKALRFLMLNIAWWTKIFCAIHMQISFVTERRKCLTQEAEKWTEGDEWYARFFSLGDAWQYFHFACMEFWSLFHTMWHIRHNKDVHLAAGT